MIVAQANLGRGVAPAEFTRNLERILAEFGPRAVYCFQEIDEADAPEEMDILARLTRDTHHIVGQQTAVPVLVPRHLSLASAAITPACKGLAKFTPNRTVTEVAIQLGRNFAVAVLNTHLPIDRPQTKDRRADVRKALRTRALLHESGIWMADTNSKHGWPTIHPDEAPVVNAGIDKAKAWAEDGRRVVVTEQRTVRLSIDGHNAHGARVRWERK